jgi:epoxide hydrolase-like protein
MEDEKIGAPEAPDGGIQPYRIDVDDSVLTDLVKRLENTRWSPQIESIGWSGGTDGSYLRGLVGYWREGYDWRNEERKLNQFAHYRTKVDGTGIHFIYERGKGPSTFPLLSS